MYKYRVIWFDDEHASLNLIREKAYLDDIELIGFGNAKQGIKELERNIKSYDAAVIDGIFFCNPEQSGTATNDDAISEVAKMLTRMEGIKKLPWFILSGEPSFTKQKNRVADVFKDNQVYDKLDDTQLIKLWFDIKIEADQQIETQIRLKYRMALDLCSKAYLGEDAIKTLMFVLESIERDDEKGNTENKLTALRKLVEKIFSLLNKIHVLPDTVWKGPGNISNSSKFLGGVHPGFNYREKVFSPTIAFLVKNILCVTQDGSHAEGDLSLQVDSFIKTQPTGYLFNSVVFQLMEVLIWLKEYVDHHKNFADNSLMAWPKATNLREGTIQQDKQGNYYCEGAIITYNHFNENRYSVGDKIRIIKTAENTNMKTMHLYSNKISESEKILII